MLPEAEAGSQLRERGGGVRIGRLGCPHRARRAAQRAGTDQDDVGTSPQEPHHEPVGLAVVGDQPVRAAIPGNATTPSSVETKFA